MCFHRFNLLIIPLTCSLFCDLRISVFVWVVSIDFNLVNLSKTNGAAEGDILNLRNPNIYRATAAVGSDAISPQTETSLLASPPIENTLSNTLRIAGCKESWYSIRLGLPLSAAIMY